MALLESEVNEFWDSKIYFKNEPTSRQAIDLLLGTQVSPADYIITNYV